MHPKNLHSSGYDLSKLALGYPLLLPYILKKNSVEDRIDFSDYNAVRTLNEALLATHYEISSSKIPSDFLIPPVPSRVDYIHHLEDLEQNSKVRVLDIGTGASLIYPLLGSAIYNWDCTAVEVNAVAIASARAQLEANPQFKKNITIVVQPDRGSIFKNVIHSNDYYHYTLCNPPFYSSEEEARKANAQKNRNLGISKHHRNFKGISNELWCNGGEALFIKRMIKESVLFKSQVQWFTCLVSQSEHIPKIYKQLAKIKAIHKTIPMTHGNKKTRFIAWQFPS